MEVVKNGIYGEDTGCLNQELLDRIQTLLVEKKRHAEVFIWNLVEEFGGFMWNYNHVRAGGRYNYPHTDETDKEYENWRLAQAFLVGQTKNFGVVFDPEDPKKIFRSESYDKWYKFWHNYFKVEMSYDTWHRFSYALSHDKDLSEFIPNKSWND